MSKDQTIINKLLSGKLDKKYQGKQVVVSEGEVYILPKDDQKAKEFFDKLILKHPQSTPTVTFVPKTGTYILLLKS